MPDLANVVVFGRANVGKSTLFNRLIGSSKALTSKLSGTTRDINTGTCSWRGYNFNTIDTGGIDKIIPQKKIKALSPKANQDFALDIIKQTQAQIKKADLILFLVDTKTDILPQDKELVINIKKLLADLNKKNLPIILVANKADSAKDRLKASEFFSLGLGEPQIISATSGSGTGDLLDQVIKILKKNKKATKRKKKTDQAIKVSILGRPNAGKSSILNSILGQEKVIVSDIPHTTREPNDTFFQYKDQEYILIDTAGIRRKSKIDKGIEKASVNKSLTSLKKSDVCIFVIDISKPLTTQDKYLSNLIVESGISLIIVANKWDLIDEKDFDGYTLKIHRHFPYLLWAPIVFVSAKTNLRTKKLLEFVKELNQAKKIQIPDNAMSKFLKATIKRHKPKAAKGIKQPYIYHLKQIKADPPVFELKVKKNDTLQDNYIKFLERQIREKFKFTGTPIDIKVRK